MVSNTKESHCDGCGVLDDFKDGLVFVRGTKTWFACSSACASQVAGAIVFTWSAGYVNPKPESLLMESPQEPAGKTLEETMGELKAKRDASAEEPKPKRGRPPKNGVARAVSPGPDVIHDLKCFVLAHPGMNPNGLTKEQISEVNGGKQLTMKDRERIVEPPRWCRCGAPVHWTGKTWECPEQHMNPLENLLAVKQGMPGENLSKLLKDAKDLKLELNLVDVAGWPVLRRDMLRAWVASLGSDEPTFLPAELARWERTPEGHINNCSLANLDAEKNCQACGGTCPDRERFPAQVPPVQEAPQTSAYEF
jgi:hypothetical protein